MTDFTGSGTGRTRTEVFEVLADERRRIALSILSRSGEPMARTDLAVAVAETVRNDGGAAVTVEAVLRKLHHVHLPKLAAAGFVTYDADEETVIYEGHPELDAEWLVVDSDDPSREILSVPERTHE